MTQDPDFNSGEITAQTRWDTSQIWDEERRKRLLLDRVPEELIDRITGMPFFFIATSSESGECDCSFKGGGPGIIQFIDPTHFAFPDIAGNGAFMSIGNILENPHIGCLFIDFSDGGRLRINGKASIHDSGDIKELFPDYPRVILVEVTQVVPNCSAHIPKLISEA
jgi:hypothetical protein